MQVRSLVEKYDSILMDPRFNLREACKELLMLEDHLHRPDKRCADCIAKHFLKAEAFLDEAYGLDTEEEYTDVIESMLGSLRALQAAWWQDEDEGDVAQGVRLIRKELMHDAFEPMSEAVEVYLDSGGRIYE